MKCLAIVPARSGSKGFANKNIAKVGNKTLVELAVGIAVDCQQVDDVYISTDSSDYEKLAIDAGAHSLGLRSSSLSGDTVKTVDVVMNLLTQLPSSYDIVVLLQPTSPVRRTEDIGNVLAQLNSKRVDAVVSLTKQEEPHPFKLKQISEPAGYIVPFMKEQSSEIPRQLMPEVYKLNGAIYAIKTEILIAEETFFPKRTMPYLMKSSVNVDTEEDYLLLTALYGAKKIEMYGAVE